MPALARLQASSCSHPELDLFTKVNGVLTDVAVLEFQIFEKVSNPLVPVQVFPTIIGNRETVNLAALCPTGHKLGTGHYVAAYTPPITELIGTHIVRWYFKLTLAAPEQSFSEEFEVLPEATASSASGYTTVQAMRDEGVTTSQASDARLQTLIERASYMIDMWTGRYFEPRTKVIRVDGRDARAVLLDEPIIDITAIKILDSYGTTIAYAGSDTDVDLDDVRIYNRHLTQLLTDPDDRDNPRIEFAFPSRASFGGRFPVGRQNIQVEGIFGYTEPDGTPHGRTPLLIEHATKLMVIRELALMSDTDARADTINRQRITMQKTRDQSISYGAASSHAGTYSAGGLGRMTGDPEIDAILERFTRPTHLGAA